MDKIQRIREEIEKRFIENELNYKAGDETELHRMVEDKAIITIIDSIIKEEPASEDLEGEVAAFLNQYSYPREEIDFSSFARHIAHWQKQQMMKEALEAEVVSGAVVVRKELMIEAIRHLNVGTKVKLIIIKED